MSVVLPSPHAHNISLTKCKMASRKRKANSDGSTDNEYFTWTDEETALLLNVALSYKMRKRARGKNGNRYEQGMRNYKNFSLKDINCCIMCIMLLC